MLNSAPGAIVMHTQKRNKREIYCWKDNFLYFQSVECTHFKTKFPYKDA
jgi:hypothetical protein